MLERKIFAARLATVRTELRKRRLDGLLVNDPIDVGYLAGFTGEDSWVLVSAGRGWLLTDFRFQEQAQRECPDFCRLVRRGRMVDALSGLLRRKGVTRLGYDPETMSMGLLSRLRRATKDVRLVRAPRIVTGMRSVKDDSEVRAICRAVAVAEEAWKMLRRRIRMGMCEWQIAAELDHQMRLAGAEAPAFPTIVAIDASASMPHARPGPRRLKRGSVLLVDFGAKVAGYVCDLTRVLLAGRIPPHVRRVYDIVFKAQAAGIAAVRPGAACTEVDGAARRVISEAGYGDRFRHGTGHGIGRQVHEAPYLAARDAPGRLAAGMVVTVEPGIYLPGRFGVRIEDDVLVTPSGHRVLTGVEKDLDAMVL